MLAHRAGEADDLVDRLPLHPHAGDQRADLRRSGLAVHHLVHHNVGLALVQGAAGRDAGYCRTDTGYLRKLGGSGRRTARGGHNCRRSRGFACLGHLARDIEEVREDLGSLGGEHALGMELHAEDRQRLVLQTHDETVGSARGDAQRLGHGRGVDAQRVVSSGGERRVDSGEEAAAVVVDLVRLAVHRLRRPAHLASVDLRDALVAEAHAEHRHAGRGRGSDHVARDARVIGRSGTGRDDDAAWLQRERVLGSDRVVAPDLDLATERGEQLHKVVGERVVVVDHEDHEVTSVAETERGAAEGAEGADSSACMPAASSSA